MNERLKELVMQAGFSDMAINHHGSRKIIECFAELVRQDEREACARLLNDFAKTTMVPVVDSFKAGLKAGAYAILSRGEK